MPGYFYTSATFTIEDFVKKVIVVSSTIQKMTVRITFMEDAKTHGAKTDIGQYVSIG